VAAETLLRTPGADRERGRADLGSELRDSGNPRVAAAHGEIRGGATVPKRTCVGRNSLGHVLGRRGRRRSGAAGF